MSISGTNSFFFENASTSISLSIPKVCFTDNLNNKEIEKKVSNYSLEEVKAFKIFNIPPTKNTEIIKKTYKKLVKKYHPDYNMGNKEYENKIKEINQAYNDIKDIK